jgi:hypothetical protein
MIEEKNLINNNNININQNNKEEQQKNLTENNQNIQSNYKDKNEIELIENKNKYILLNENPNNSIDILNEFKNSLTTLKEGEMLYTENFKLEDTMNAFELNHIKMDPHYHNENVDTYIKLLNKNIIKKFEDLDLNESLILIDEIFKRFINFLYGASIYQNILELIYISDIRINKDEDLGIFKNFLDGLFHCFYLIYYNSFDVTCLREEDFSIIYYNNCNYFKRENIFEKIEKNLKELNNELLKKKDNANNNEKKLIEQIINRFEIIKILINILTEQFDKNNNNRFEFNEKIEKFKKLIDSIDFEFSNNLPNYNEIIKNYFNPYLLRVLPCLGSSKKNPFLKNNEAIEKLNYLYESFKDLNNLYKQKNFYHIKKKLMDLNKLNSSFIIKEIAERNLFNNNLLFISFDINEFFLNFLKQLKIDFIKDENIFNYLVNILKELLKIQLKNKSRYIRESRDIIDNLTAICLEGHKYETNLTNKSNITKTVLTNFLLKTNLEEMFEIIMKNFKINMFKIYELDFVFYVGENILNQILMHTCIIINKVNEKILNEENFVNSKIKKKLTQIQRMFVEQINILKCLKTYFKEFKNIFYFIKKRHIIKLPSELNEEKIFNNRFPYFKNVNMFISFNYENFMNEMNNLNKDLNFLDSSKENIKDSLKYLTDLKNADEKLRDIGMYNNEFLTNLMKCIMANVLFIGKIKKISEEENKQVKINYNNNKYETFLPCFEIIN